MPIASTPTTELIDCLRTARRLPPPAACRAIRLAAGATQQQLADALDADRVTVARWELGERSPRGELRLRYISLLDSLREALIDPREDGSPAAAEATRLPATSDGQVRDAQAA